MNRYTEAIRYCCRVKDAEKRDYARRYLNYLVALDVDYQCEGKEDDAPFPSALVACMKARPAPPHSLTPRQARDVRRTVQARIK